MEIFPLWFYYMSLMVKMAHAFNKNFFPCFEENLTVVHWKFLHYGQYFHEHF
jgi:hypothetical protein